ncbi:NAD dependent epimerase/dehydratase [Aspergillus sclerotiicarbonarius CBS 121057]|uniref:NAD dependent epimerase/dehydratase n=1 Tax=Aspergillus sclerotiicarbonarius (strain CBS 121057 / IBT 28362) TaxID=1448318 RepID=A0A319E993_ASPSB|nr:NAD dependent epimerase/dehydratase [Aspergillus sclerotiicarbonarius CBS 121057]
MSIFVCGATGTQGGAITRHLVQKNIQVHTITRTPSSPAAQYLQSLGVRITKGDYDDEASLRDSLTGCTGLFLNTMPDFLNPKNETIRGRRVLTLAKEAGVKYVVYSSAFAVNEPQKIRTFTPTSFTGKLLLSKQALEIATRTSGFERWTILRPGNFMTNFLAPRARMYTGLVETKCWTTAWTPETQIAMVDPDDIGRVGAEALFDERFHEAEIELAAELLTVEEILGALAQVTGAEFKADYMAEEDIGAQVATNVLIQAQLALRDMAQFADLEKIRDWGLNLGTFEKFLERKRENVGKTYST